MSHLQPTLRIFVQLFKPVIFESFRKLTWKNNRSDSNLGPLAGRLKFPYVFLLDVDKDIAPFPNQNRILSHVVNRTRRDTGKVYRIFSLDFQEKYFTS